METQKLFYVPCGSQNLNLFLGVVLKSSVTAVNLFGTLQKIYNRFAVSCRWDNQKLVKNLCPKTLSETRWECRTENVKAVRFQVPDFQDAWKYDI